jgi:multiple sugar transport system substrate-binding protein
MGSGDFPAQKSVLALFATDEEFASPPASYLRVAADEATVNPVPRPVTPGYLEYEQILQNTFDDIRTGANVEEALNLAVERISSEMVKYSR